MNKAFIKRLLDDNTQIVGRDEDGMLYFGTPYLCVRFPKDTPLPDEIEYAHTELVAPYRNIFEDMVRRDTKLLKMPTIDEIDDYTKGYRRGDPVRYDFLKLNPRLENAPVVNALYLRNILDLYSKKDKLYGAMSEINKPLLFWNDAEYANQTQTLLFQIRRKD